MILPAQPLAAYETTPMPSVSRAQLRQIVDHHALQPDGPVLQLASSGVVHSLWALGSRWVLRVPKDEPMCIGDHLCEAVAIPLVRRIGISTPDLVVFDDSRSILAVPFTVVTRIDGTDLSRHPFGHPAYEQVGHQLAELHAADLSDHEHPWLRDTSDLAAVDHLEDVIAAGLLHREGAEWVQLTCERLRAVVERGPSAPRVFIHDDVKPDNVMIDRAGKAHLIDWGDAGFGDPAHDFQSLPMRAIEVALRGYRSVRSDDPTLETRIVLRVLARSLSNLRRTPLLGPSWYRPIAANLTDLMSFAVDNPATWARWTTGV